MYKVYLAVGNEGVERYIKSQKPLLEKMLNDTVNFVGVTVYKEGALQGIKDYHPDVVILREGLQGNMDVLDLIYKIRLESSNTRIIFITKTREVGDAFLATTVQMGVYDLIVGDKISVKDLLKKIVHPTRFVDVAHYIPKITIDERTSKTIFSAPNVDELVKQRVEAIMEKQEEADAATKNSSKTVVSVENGPSVIAPIAESQSESSEGTLADENSDSNTPIPSLLKDTEKDIPKFIKHEPEPIPVAVFTDKDDYEIPQVVQVSDEDKAENEEVNESPITPPSNINNNIPDTFFIEDDDDDDFEYQIPINKFDIESVKPVPVEQTPVEQAPAKEPPVVEVKSDTIPEIEPIPPIVTPASTIADTTAGVIAGTMANEWETPSRITATDKQPEPMVNPYVLEPLVKQVKQEKQEPKKTTSKKGFSLFKKKNSQKTVPAQIITFWGAGDGVGNSQVAFNAAIALANQGYHVLYADLNDKFSAIESMMQLGFEDLGIDTMLNNIEQGKNDKVGHAISSIAKILPFTDKRDFLYKTYTNMPSSLNFAFFSQHCFEHRTGIEYNVELLRELNMMWLMDFGYDIIVLDAPADVTNRLTQLALAYANKVFITLNQDKTVLSRMLKQMKYLSQQRISIREKSFYIVNRFENSAFSYNNLQNFISMNLEYEKLELLSIPNLPKDFINSIYNGTPIILSCKNKELQKTMADIVTLIES